MGSNDLKTTRFDFEDMRRRGLLDFITGIKDREYVLFMSRDGQKYEMSLIEYFRRKSPPYIHVDAEGNIL